MLLRSCLLLALVLACWGQQTDHDKTTQIFKKEFERLAKLQNCQTVEQEETLTQPGCRPKKVKLNVCKGMCLSMTRFKYDYPYYTSVCSCCKKEKMKVEQIDLQCDNGIIKIMLKENIQSCRCGTCS